MTGQVVPALSAVDLAKSFGPTLALQGASLELRAGEVHALLGENGSGKSTFAKVLAGIHQPDRGRIRRNGREISIVDPAAGRALGIGIVFQELSLAPALDVVDNLFLGRERRRFYGWLDRRRQVEECREMLDRLGLDVDPRQPARVLSIAEKQMLEIAKALLQEPDILILDEPTASLTERETAQLFHVIEQLRDRGTAILYVTHQLREVLRIADRVSVMREGRIAAQLEISDDVTEEMLIGLLTDKRLGSSASTAGLPDTAPLLRVSRLRTANSGHVSLHIRPGEIVGLYGVVGCGREEIARCLVGLLRPLAGALEFDGRPYDPRGPADALDKGIGFLAGDRKQDGVLPNRPTRENLTLAGLRLLARAGFVRQREEQSETDSRLASLRVKYRSPEDSISTLSGGNQQKVLFGRALFARPKMLVLEDPTAGIDVGAKYDLYEQIRQAAGMGMSFLWLSTDLTETLTLCHRVYAMRGGLIAAEIIAPSPADEERLLSAVLGRAAAEAAA